jgi:hypothetical protein
MRVFLEWDRSWFCISVNGSVPHLRFSISTWSRSRCVCCAQWPTSPRRMFRIDLRKVRSTQCELILSGQSYRMASCGLAKIHVKISR